MGPVSLLPEYLPAAACHLCPRTGAPVRGGTVLTSPLEKGLACPLLWSVMEQVPQPSAEETNSANPCTLQGFLTTWQGKRARTGWAGDMSTCPKGQAFLSAVTQRPLRPAPWVRAVLTTPLKGLLPLSGSQHELAGLAGPLILRVRPA